jgi:hypothetical protein
MRRFEAEFGLAGLLTEVAVDGSDHEFVTFVVGRNKLKK